MPNFLFRMGGYSSPPFYEKHPHNSIWQPPIHCSYFLHCIALLALLTVFTLRWKQPKIFWAKCLRESQLSIRTGSAAATQFETFAPSRQTHHLVIWVISTRSQKAKILRHENKQTYRKKKKSTNWTLAHRGPQLIFLKKWSLLSLMGGTNWPSWEVDYFCHL